MPTWPNIAVNDQVAIVFEGTLISQRVRTTFHYNLKTLTGGPLAINNAVDALHTDTQMGALRSAFLDVCPSNYTFDRVSYQYLKDPNVAYMKIYYTIDDVGTRTAALSPNQQASITRRSLLATRKWVGGIRVPLNQSETDQGNGFITPAYKALLDALAGLMDDEVTCTFGGGDSETWEPTMFRRGNDGDWLTEPVAQVRAMQEVRTIRRRTVGLGE